MQNRACSGNSACRQKKPPLEQASSGCFAASKADAYRFCLFQAEIDGNFDRRCHGSSIFGPRAESPFFDRRERGLIEDGVPGRTGHGDGLDAARGRDGCTNHHFALPRISPRGLGIGRRGISVGLRGGFHDRRFCRPGRRCCPNRFGCWWRLDFFRRRRADGHRCGGGFGRHFLQLLHFRERLRLLHGRRGRFGQTFFFRRGRLFDGREFFHHLHFQKLFLRKVHHGTRRSLPLTKDQDTPMDNQRKPDHHGKPQRGDAKCPPSPVLCVKNFLLHVVRRTTRLGARG